MNLVEEISVIIFASFSAVIGMAKENSKISLFPMFSVYYYQVISISLRIYRVVDLIIEVEFLFSNLTTIDSFSSSTIETIYLRRYSSPIRRSGTVLGMYVNF